MSWFMLQLSRHTIPVPSTFVETGSYQGDGIEQYIQCLPFKTVHSIELSPQWAEHCRQRFRHCVDRVHIHEGDSASIFPTLPLPSEPVLFYLDAHFSGGKTAGEDIDNGCPVIRELTFIAQRGVSGDVIFVDDIRLMGKDSISGIEGHEVYPATRFDFRHASLEAMRNVFATHGREYMWEMCASYDRLLIVLK